MSEFLVYNFLSEKYYNKCFFRSVIYTRRRKRSHQYITLGGKHFNIPTRNDAFEFINCNYVPFSVLGKGAYFRFFNNYQVSVNYLYSLQLVKNTIRFLKKNVYVTFVGIRKYGFYVYAANMFLPVSCKIISLAIISLFSNLQFKNEVGIFSLIGQHKYSSLFTFRILTGNWEPFLIYINAQQMSSLPKKQKVYNLDLDEDDLFMDEDSEDYILYYENVKPKYLENMPSKLYRNLGLAASTYLFRRTQLMNFYYERGVSNLFLSTLRLGLNLKSIMKLRRFQFKPLFLNQRFRKFRLRRRSNSFRILRFFNSSSFKKLRYKKLSSIHHNSKLQNMLNKKNNQKNLVKVPVIDYRRS